jgi:hypothetical protein
MPEPTFSIIFRYLQLIRQSQQQGNPKHRPSDIPNGTRTHDWFVLNSADRPDNGNVFGVVFVMSR